MQKIFVTKRRYKIKSEICVGSIMIPKKMFYTNGLFLKDIKTSHRNTITTKLDT